MRKFGIHASIVGGYSLALRRAVEAGADTFQMFAGPPRNYKRDIPTPEVAEEFKAARKEAGVAPVVVHAGYLLHLLSPKEAVARKALELFNKEYETATVLGAEYYVIHIGSSLPDRDMTLDLICEILSSGPSGGPMVLLENSSHILNGIGARFDELGQILNTLNDKERFGICFDTAHATGAGYDLSSAAAVSKTMKEIYSDVGKSSIKVVHANDSKAERGSGRDLHEHIGKGHVGADGFKALLADTTLKKLPFILETPQNKDGDDAKNLAALRKLAGNSK